MDITIAVLTVGDELLNGEMPDGNTAEIARILGAKGFSLRESRSVGDEETEIGDALGELAEKRDVVIVTGGLGPTSDDLTARAAARGFGRRLVLNEEALQQIREHFRRLGREMHPRNEKQALLPHKVSVLPNSRGSAPGFLLRHSECDLFFLPGVPAEMSAMLKAAVLPHLQRAYGEPFPLQERVLKLFGLPEPKVEELLAEEPLPEGVSVAYGVDFPMVHLKLRASGEEADSLLDRADLQARKALGEHVVAVGEETLAGNVARMLTAAGLTLSLAESCTGGLIAKLLTDVPGASSFLERGAVTYANSAKRDWLGVPTEVLENQGAVSKACAQAMADGMRRAAGTDLALAVTGIAGPEGGTPQKPVGTVYIALATAEGVRVKDYRFGGDRDRVRLMAACMGLAWMFHYLGKRLSRTGTFE